MTTSELLAELQDAFEPSLFGDASKAERDERVMKWFGRATGLASSLAESKRPAAIESYVRWKAFDKAYMYLLAQAERVDVAAEGSTDLGDINERLRSMARERDAARGLFEGAFAVPETEPASNRPATSGTLPVEFSF